jgi:hypothetical protein
MPTHELLTDSFTVLILTGVRSSAVGMATEGSEFDSQYDEELSLSHMVETDTGAHALSYTNAYRGLLLRRKAAGA